MLKVFKVYNIDWNTDGEHVDGLPTEVNIEIMMESGQAVSDILTDDAIEWVSNLLSDSYDWLVDGFEYQRITH